MAFIENFVRLVFLLFVAVPLFMQVGAQECSIHLTCGECIGNAGCSWCSSNSQSFQGARHCGLYGNLSAAGCNMFEDPRDEEIVATTSGDKNPVNVTNVRMSLRVGEPRTFSVSVTPLRNLPLDLYVLSDLSGSMGENLRALKQIGGNIANEISSLTDDVRIGFGSFNEKITRPYTYYYTTTNCNKDHCLPNYAFRHRISLTSNITFYNITLQGVQVTRNTDRPENGLEALAQVVACEDIIGWRSRSATGDDRGLTRVVLFMTDDAFHYSGEGQLAGILKPYEGECLLEPPADDQSTVEFTRWREVSSPVLSNNRGCNKVQLETTVQFQVSVTLNNCNGLQQPGTEKIHRVSAGGFGSFEIIYTGECQCPCERNITMQSEDCNGNGDFACGICTCHEGWCGPSCSRRTDEQADEVCQRGGINNELCSGPARGICRCSCECTEPYFGLACECDRSDNSCPRNARGEHCNGQGDCCNGRCRCGMNEGGYQYRHNGTREDCACPPVEAVCLDSNNTICNEHGSCACSGCNCRSGFFGQHCQSRDVGTCGDSEDISCIQQCVDGDFNSDICRQCEGTRPIIVVTQDVPDNTQLNEFLQRQANRELGNTITGSSSYVYELDCETTIAEDCTYMYYLLKGPEMYAVLLLQESVSCLSDAGDGGISLPFEAYYFAPIILGALFILGLIIFVFAKMVIFVLDYMEVKRLDKETKNVEFKGNNPLYQNPEMEYKNVAYGRE